MRLVIFFSARSCLRPQHSNASLFMRQCADDARKVYAGTRREQKIHAQEGDVHFCSLDLLHTVHTSQIKRYALPRVVSVGNREMAIKRTTLVN